MTQEGARDQDCLTIRKKTLPPPAAAGLRKFWGYAPEVSSNGLQQQSATFSICSANLSDHFYWSGASYDFHINILLEQFHLIYNSNNNYNSLYLKIIVCD